MRNTDTVLVWYVPRCSFNFYLSREAFI